MYQCNDGCQSKIFTIFMCVFVLFMVLVLPGCLIIYVEGGAGSIVVDDHEQQHRVIYDIPPINTHDQPDFSNDIDPEFTHDDDRVRL